MILCGTRLDLIFGMGWGGPVLRVRPECLYAVHIHPRAVPQRLFSYAAEQLIGHPERRLLPAYCCEMFVPKGQHRPNVVPGQPTVQL